MISSLLQLCDRRRDKFPFKISKVFARWLSNDFAVVYPLIVFADDQLQRWIYLRGNERSLWIDIIVT
jgi:hypothetical protein